jgi:hypothetical protein
MADIIHMYETTALDQRPEEVIEGVLANKPAHLFIIAWPSDGSKPTYHSTTSDAPVILMRLAEFQHKYFNGDFYEERG